MCVLLLLKILSLLLYSYCCLCIIIYMLLLLILLYYVYIYYYVGPVDAAYKAIRMQIPNTENFKLLEYTVSSVTAGIVILLYYSICISLVYLID